MNAMGLDRRRAITLVSAAVLLVMVACVPPRAHVKALRTISALDCPDSQADLTLKTAVAGGKSCVYADEEGDQLALELVTLDGKDAGGVLSPIEAQVKAEAPAVTADGATQGAKADTAGDGKDKVDIDLPGLHIHANDGGHTNVDAAGVHVDAHDGPGGGDHANVRIGDATAGKGVTVNAGDHQAQVRVQDNGPGVHAVYILTSENPGPHGYKSVGYEARGPKAGPIVVAIMLSKSNDTDDLRDAARSLLRRNVGG